MADQAARTLHPEDEISHYRIVGPLGAGGMGEVYLAQDQSLERRVALKVLPPELVRSEERVRRFVLEAKSASSLSHPNIVTIYEIGHDPVRAPGEPPSAPVHFISMELVRGKTLSALIHEDKADLRSLLGYLAQAAEGLAKAHAAGIVHRDLKPGNIMVTADGYAKVLDFGLAKLTEKQAVGPDVTNAPTMGADATSAGIVVGTAGYMSPEQVQGKSVDHRSDIFSLGCILYEAATRRRPFVAETAVETMHKILHEKPPPVEDIDAKVPAEVRRVIRRCLAKNPELRLQSMKDLAIELREIVDEYDSLSASASSGSMTPGAIVAPPARRAPVWPWIAGAVVVVGVAAVAWWSAQHPAAKEQPFQSMRMSTQTSRGDVLDCVISADGRFLAYLAGTAGRASLRVRQVATGSDVEVLPVTEGLQSPAFSRDGDYLYYLAIKPDARNYRTLFQIPSLGGAPVERAFDVDSRVSFSPDGKRMAFWRGVPLAQEFRIVTFDLGTGKERILAAVPNRQIVQGALDWSPDGKHLALGLFEPGSNLRSTIALFDADTGRRQDLHVLERMILSSVAWLRDGTGLVAAGTDLNASLSSQLFLVGYPDARSQRLTNDFNQYLSVSASGDQAVAAVRKTRLENLWVADVRGDARQITSVSSPENSPFSVAVADSGSVVYSATRDQDLQLWSSPMSGGAPRMLTTGTGLCIDSHGAPGVIVFNRVDPSGMHVWSMAPDGSGLRQLTSGAGERLTAFSRDGRFATVARFDSVTAVWLLSVESGEVSHFAHADGSLGFSPDGRFLLAAFYERDASGLQRVLWRALPVAGGAPVAQLRLPGQASNQAWSPDSHGMTFLDTGDPAWNVYRQGFDDKTPAPVTRFTDGRVTSFAWSPDGTKLALVRRVGPATNAWITEADGSRPVQVTHFTSEEIFEMQWLPNSRGLVVDAGTSSADAVLIRNFR
jgi:Tol biopolymer transport system component